MNDLRKAAEMALWALRYINQYSLAPHNISLPGEIDTAVDALRAALAQPEQTAMPPDIAKVLFDNVESLYVEDAQPEQEPVMFNGLTEEETNASASVMGLTPPQRKPLTEEEIYKLLGYDNQHGVVPGYAMSFVRAVEKAHRIE